MAEAIRLVVKLNKLPALMAMLDTVEDTMADRTADKALGHVQEHTPVDTGRLLNSYHVENHGRGVRIITNGPEAFYALFVELGTRYALAQPHVVPGALDTAQDIPGIWEDVIRSAVG